MDKAGFDPVKQLTYEQYRDAARKITQQGNGQAYGVTMGAEPRILNRQVVNMATIAGQPMNEDGMDLRTGQFAYLTDAVMTIIELYQQIKSDGSFFPGIVSMTQQVAYSSFPQGNAGMVFTGQWVIPPWDKAGFEYGLGPLPAPSGVDPNPLDTPPIGGPAPYVYAKTPNPAVAGEIMSYLGSPDGVRTWTAFTCLGSVPTWPNILSDTDDPKVKSSLSLADKAGIDHESPANDAAVKLAKTTRVAPQPTIRNPAQSAVQAAFKAPVPSFGEILQAMLVDKVPSIDSALRDLQNKSNQALDDAIEAVKKKGGHVSRDDYVFQNYDPTKDYGPTEYAELSK